MIVATTAAVSAPYAMPQAVTGSVANPALWLRTATTLPTVASAVPSSPNPMPIAALPPWRAASSSGRNSSATPVTPSTAATNVRSVSGVPNARRMPTGAMNTIVENTTATNPDGTKRSAQYTHT